ncbi:hypothetical protein [Methylocaldum gracile]|jgi:hypothetical protein|uniref:hypothetical protein n=1 Tax=Methylocaldum sp. 0917 TaxID=2485163 RepID=UPI00105FAF08
MKYIKSITQARLVAFALFTTGIFTAPLETALAYSPPVPEGYDSYFVYIANGLFDPSQPSPDPNVTNCDPMTNLCDGYYYQHEIIGRTDEEITQREQQAKDYFRDRFGVDVDDPANQGRIFFKMFQMDPRINLHIIAAAGEKLPPEGWNVRDGGWIAMIMDPNGFDLGGELGAGQHVPMGTFFVFAEYSIQVTDQHSHKNRKPIVLQVHSVRPQIPGSQGFQCELIHKDHGLGLVQGWAEAIMRPDGLTKMNITGVLTFPGLGNVEPVR